MSAREHRPEVPGTRPPAALLALAAVGALLFILPLVGLVAEVSWADVRDMLGDPVARDALRVSLVSSSAAVVLSVLVGVPLAYVLARGQFRGRTLLRSIVLLPLVLPPVVGGAALLFALGRRGVVGEPLHAATGLVLPFSTVGVVIAVTFVSMPFLVLTVEGALRNLDGRVEGAAATLGAGRWTVLRRVTLPLIAPSLAAGLALTWARALGEFGATLAFAGNLQGRTQTVPLAVFVALQRDRGAAVAMSLVMVVLAFAVIVLLRDHWWDR